MKKKEVDLFEKLYSQMEALHEEIGALSKKSPNDALNKFKLKVINSLLQETNTLLQGEYKPLQDFDLFNEDALPTNSDVALILAQYLNCMEKLRADNVKLEFGTWYWIIDGKQSAIETAQPRKLKTR